MIQTIKPHVGPGSLGTAPVAPSCRTGRHFRPGRCGRPAASGHRRCDARRWAVGTPSRHLPSPWRSGTAGGRATRSWLVLGLKTHGRWAEFLSWSRSGPSRLRGPRGSERLSFFRFLSWGPTVFTIYIYTLYQLIRGS